MLAASVTNGLSPDTLNTGALFLQHDKTIVSLVDQVVMYRILDERLWTGQFKTQTSSSIQVQSTPKTHLKRTRDA